MFEAALEASSVALTPSTFDFLPATWNVVMRRRKVDGHLEVLNEWNEFPASATFQSVLGGKAIFGQYVMNMPDGVLNAIDLRIFNPETSGWTIYWASDKDHQWQDNPMRGGSSVGSTITLTIDDTFDGCPVITRYRWKVDSDVKAFWEQSFSNDHGKTWVSNWEMHFTRSS